MSQLFYREKSRTAPWLYRRLLSHRSCCEEGPRSVSAVIFTPEYGTICVMGEIERVLNLDAELQPTRLYPLAVPFITRRHTSWDCSFQGLSVLAVARDLFDPLLPEDDFQFGKKTGCPSIQPNRPNKTANSHKIGTQISTAQSRTTLNERKRTSNEHSKKKSSLDYRRLSAIQSNSPNTRSHLFHTHCDIFRHLPLRGTALLLVLEPIVVSPWSRI